MVLHLLVMTTWKPVFFDKSPTRTLIINPFCKRSSLNARFAPKATEWLRRREMATGQEPTSV